MGLRGVHPNRESVFPMERASRLPPGDHSQSSPTLSTLNPLVDGNALDTCVGLHEGGSNFSLVLGQFLWKPDDCHIADYIVCPGKERPDRVGDLREVPVAVGPRSHLGEFVELDGIPH